MCLLNAENFNQPLPSLHFLAGGDQIWFIIYWYLLEFMIAFIRTSRPASGRITAPHCQRSGTMSHGRDQIRFCMAIFVSTKYSSGSVLVSSDHKTRISVWFDRQTLTPELYSCNPPKPFLSHFWHLSANSELSLKIIWPYKTFSCIY